MFAAFKDARKCLSSIRGQRDGRHKSSDALHDKRRLLVQLVVKSVSCQLLVGRNRPDNGMDSLGKSGKIWKICRKIWKIWENLVGKSVRKICRKIWKIWKIWGHGKSGKIWGQKIWGHRKSGVRKSGKICQKIWENLENLGSWKIWGQACDSAILMDLFGILRLF